VMTVGGAQPAPRAGLVVYDRAAYVLLHMSHEIFT
jgi:hypothetical protein